MNDFVDPGCRSDRSDMKKMSGQLSLYPNAFNQQEDGVSEPAPDTSEHSLSHNFVETRQQAQEQVIA
jgi:hypothetical protein